MNKNELTDSLCEWLSIFLDTRYSKEYNIEIIKPDSHLSRNTNLAIKKLDGYTSFDFHTDIVGLLTHKNSGEVEVVLMNRSTSAISLKEIGEMNCYSKILKSKHSFLASTKGLPDEVNLILLNDEVAEKLLKISDNMYIHIFKWDAESNQIDSLSAFPLKNNIITNK